MAIIDRFDLKEYDDYIKFRIWCLRFFPRILTYLYNPFLSYKEWCEEQKENFETWVNSVKRGYEYYKCGELSQLDSAKLFFTQTFELDEKEFNNPQYKDKRRWAIEDIQFITNDYNEYKSLEDSLKHYSSLNEDEMYLLKSMPYPIGMFPVYVDKILKWFCPLDCVREYLKERCGVKKPYAWYYKLFWLGK